MLRSSLGNTLSAAAVALSVVLVQACASSSSAPVMQQGSAVRGSGKLPGSYALLERGVIDELNYARTDPQGYATSLERDLQYYRGTMFRRPGDDSPLETREGVNAVREAIRVLRQTRPLPALRPVEGMMIAARDHVNDQAPRGLMT